MLAHILYRVRCTLLPCELISIYCALGLPELRIFSFLVGLHIYPLSNSLLEPMAARHGGNAGSLGNIFFKTIILFLDCSSYMTRWVGGGWIGTQLQRTERSTNMQEWIDI